ncbi:MAG TPA: inositol monophosphatase family protein [Nitrospirota bacterium]|nr:inositol monophosphatase family protein [Nitrospirota bacterium]
MTNEQWLELFKDIGKKMREGLSSVLAREGGTVPLGKGAGGDKTFPVDKWAEDIVITALERAQKAGEAFTLISEELGVREFGQGEKIVLVDPIDGSNNAKSGIPFFSTSLALLDGRKLGTLAAAYIINLAAGDEFWAVRGKGAYKNGSLITTSASPGITIVAFEASSPSHDIPRIMPLLALAKRTRCFGSTALDLAYLASGAMSAFATATASRAFDYAAGMLILKEAGGVITDLSGANLEGIEAGLQRTVPLLASKNETAHATAVGILSSVKKG